MCFRQKDKLTVSHQVIQTASKRQSDLQQLARRIIRVMAQEEYVADDE